MRNLLLALSLMLGAALVPANAQESASEPQAKQDETVHPPTNRVGEEVPTMKPPEDGKTGAASDGKEMHPPTNRVGERVPTMTDKEPKQDQSKTYDGSGSTRTE